MCAALCVQQPSAECVLEKDARDLVKGIKLRRVLHVPLLALVWTYWFTFHFSPFWQVIRHWYFSFMSLRLAWRVQWKIVLLSGICEWRINFQTSVSTYLSLQHHQVKGWCICFCRYCCRDHKQAMKEFRRKQWAWMETEPGFAFWRGLHNQGS